MYKEKRRAGSGRKNMPVIALFTAAVLAVLPAWTAVRAEAANLPETCNLEVEQDDHGEGTGRPGLTVDLYRVAGADDVENYEAYSLTTEDPYKGFQKELEGVMNKETEGQAAEEYGKLAQKVLKRALDIQGEPKKGDTVETSSEALSPDYSINLSEKRSFEKLAPGMYLMVVRGTNLTKASDYVTVLDGGEFATAAYAGGNLYLYSPELIALPQWDEEEGRWNDEVKATLKSERSREYVSLKIRKETTSIQGGTRPTGEDHFVYQIEATFGGKTVYSNVVMMTMAADKDEAELVLSKIVPAGSEITVTEVYEGAAHELENKDKRTVLIAYAAEDGDDGTPGNEAVFVNRYTGIGIGGGGIENRFSYETKAEGADKDGWKWEPYPEKVKRP